MDCNNLIVKSATEPNMSAKRYLWIPEHAGAVASASDNELIVAPDSRSDEVRAAAYRIVDELIEYARIKPPADLPAILVELLEACRVSLTCGPLLAAIREWIAWTQIKKFDAPSCSIVAPQSIVPRLERDAQHLSVNAAWEKYQLPGKQKSLVAIGRMLLGKVGRRLVGAASSLADRMHSQIVPEQSERIRVMFVDYYPHSTLIVQPLWRHLQSTGRFDLLYAACRQKVAATLRNAGLDPYINLERFRITRDGAEVSRIAWKAWVVQFVRERWPDNSRACPPSLELALVECYREIAYAESSRRRLTQAFELFRPHIVVNTTGSSIEARNAELLAQKFGVTSIHVQHGLYEPDPIRANSQSDFVCCWGQLHRNLLERTPSRSRTVVTGSPKHDELFEGLAHIPKQDKPLIVYFSSRADGRVLSTAGYETHMRAIASVVRARPDWEFFVKLHQSDNYPFDGPAIAEIRSLTNARVSKTENAYELLKRASVSITYASTVALEAMGFGTRLVFLNLTGLPDWLPVDEFHLARVVRRAEELQSVLEYEVEQRHEIQPGREAALLIDGKACRRIEDLILEGARSAVAPIGTVPRASHSSVALR